MLNDYKELFFMVKQARKYKRNKNKKNEVKEIVFVKNIIHKNIKTELDDFEKQIRKNWWL